jgi:RecA-family ATPase
MDAASPEAFLAQHGISEQFAPLPPDDELDEAYGGSVGKAPQRAAVSKDAKAKPVEPIVPKLVFPTSLRGKPIPSMEWIVDGWIPVGEVTLVYGDGGTGKTLLSQQLMAYTSLGKPWCTLPVHRCKSLGVFCEDDDNELHRRQDDIQRHLMTDFDDTRMDSMAWWSRKGESNLLATFDFDGTIQPTPLYATIIEEAQKMGAGLVILDTAADLFSGNENDRGQVRQFVGLLARMAMTLNAAVVLCAHPSRSGMATGTLDSGSTGWSNSARSRLALERPKAEGDEPVDNDERVLSKKKSNRSSIGDTIKLRWKEGVIVSTRAPGFASATLADALAADDVFLILLAQTEDEGRHVSATPNASNYGPKLFGKHPGRQGFTKRDFDAAMQRLFASGRIVNEEYGRPNDRGRPRRIASVKGVGDE